MAITYTWKVVGLKKTNAANLSDVVVGTRWEKIGTDEDGNEGKFNGATPFKVSDVDPNNFVDWNNLTEELVLSWIKPVVVGQYEEHVNGVIAKEIARQKNPEVETSDMPWNPPTEVTPGANTAPNPADPTP